MFKKISTFWQPTKISDKLAQNRSSYKYPEAKIVPRKAGQQPSSIHKQMPRTIVSFNLHKPEVGKSEKTTFVRSQANRATERDKPQKTNNSKTSKTNQSWGKEPTFSQPGLLELPQVLEELCGERGRMLRRGGTAGCSSGTRGWGGGAGGGPAPCPAASAIASPPSAQAPLTFRVLRRRLARLPGGLPSAQHGSATRGLLQEERSERSPRPERTQPGTLARRSRHSPAGR